MQEQGQRTENSTTHPLKYLQAAHAGSTSATRPVQLPVGYVEVPRRFDQNQKPNPGTPAAEHSSNPMDRWLQERPSEQPWNDIHALRQLQQHEQAARYDACSAIRADSIRTEADSCGRTSEPVLTSSKDGTNGQEGRATAKIDV